MTSPGTTGDISIFISALSNYQANETSSLKILDLS